MYSLKYNIPYSPINTKNKHLKQKTKVYKINIPTPAPTPTPIKLPYHSSMP